MQNSFFVCVWSQIFGCDCIALIRQQGFGPLYFPNWSAVALGIGADGAHRVLAWYQRTCPHTIESYILGGKK